METPSTSGDAAARCSPRSRGGATRNKKIWRYECCGKCGASGIFIDCWWMCRRVERLENTSRFLQSPPRLVFPWGEWKRMFTCILQPHPEYSGTGPNRNGRSGWMGKLRRLSKLSQTQDGTGEEGRGELAHTTRIRPENVILRNGARHRGPRTVWLHLHDPFLGLGKDLAGRGRRGRGDTHVPCRGCSSESRTEKLLSWRAADAALKTVEVPDTLVTLSNMDVFFF